MLDKQTKRDLRKLAQIKRYKQEKDLHGEETGQILELNYELEDKQNMLKQLQQKHKRYFITNIILFLMLIIITLYDIIIYINKPRPDVSEPEPHIAKNIDVNIELTLAGNKEDMYSKLSRYSTNDILNTGVKEITCKEINKLPDEDTFHIDSTDNVTYYGYEDAFDYIDNLQTELIIKESVHSNDFKSDMKRIIGDYEFGYIQDDSMQLYFSDDTFWLGFSEGSFNKIIDNNMANIVTEENTDILVFSSDIEIDIESLINSLPLPDLSIDKESSDSVLDYLDLVSEEIKKIDGVKGGTHEDMNYVYHIGVTATQADEIYLLKELLNYD